MSRRSVSDDFFNAALNYRPANSSSSPQISTNSPPTPHYPPFQSTYAPHSPFQQYGFQPTFDYQQFQQFQQFQHAQQQRGFQQFHQSTPFVAPETVPDPIGREPETMPEPDPIVEPESVAEAEPSKVTRRKKGKKVADEKAKKTCNKKSWTNEEKKILAECYIDISEDNFRGNSQSGVNFWNKILESFNAQVEDPRTKDQLTSKWRVIRNEVGRFNGIYAGYDKNRRSGEDDRAVMEESRLAYFNETGKAFNFYECWLVLKDKPKFLAPAPIDVMGRSLAKRKTVVEVDNSDEEQEYENLGDPPTENELFGQDPIPRPPGKYKTAKTSGSSDAASSRSSSAAELQEKLDKIGSSRVELIESKKAALEKICEEEKKRTMFAAFSFLESGNPTAREKRFLQKARAQVMNEYKQFVQLSDDEDDEN